MLISQNAIKKKYIYIYIYNKNGTKSMSKNYVFLSVVSSQTTFECSLIPKLAQNYYQIQRTYHPINITR